MKRALSITLTALSWILLTSYIVVSANYCSTQHKEVLCREIKVVVTDSAKQGYITPYMVKSWLVNENVKLLKQPLSSINTNEIEKILLKRGYVKSAEVYSTINGTLNIKISQRIPIARVSSSNGYNFYITEDNYILPPQSYFTSYVPIITGYIIPPFERGFVGNFENILSENEKKVSKNYLFLSNLINFVKFVGNDSFWNSMIVQINVTNRESQSYNPRVEIVPRTANHVVMLGEIENFQNKLDKLMLFYKNGLNYEGWERYNYINLEYKNQVVCIKQ